MNTKTPLQSLLTTQNERHNAEAYYSSLGHNVTVRIDVDMLPKREQLQLLNRLLTSGGVFEAMRETLTDDAYKALCAAIDAKWEERAKG